MPDETKKRIKPANPSILLAHGASPQSTGQVLGTLLARRPAPESNGVGSGRTVGVADVPRY